MTAVPASLAEALGRLQANMPVITKDQRANTPQFSYAYADLAQISREVLPLLQPLGLAWITKPTTDEQGRFCLAYSLLHVSGEREDGRYPLNPQGTPQQRGSEISYARRYALCSVLGVAPESDDDGAAASAQDKPASRRASRAAPKEPEQQDGPRMISDPMSRRLHQLFNQSGITERDARLNYTSEIVKRDVPSSSDLTFAEARLLIKTLEQAQADAHDEHPDGGAS